MPAWFDEFRQVAKAVFSGEAVVAGAVGIAVLLAASMPATAKTPGAVHCYGGSCHRVASIGEMDGMVGRRGILKASYYDDCKKDRFNPCGLTSSGAVFRADLADNAASPIFPDGTVLLTYNHDSRQAVVVRVTNAGPYWVDRTLDLSRAAAERLGFLRDGVAALEVMILSSPNVQEARYQKLRSYDPVPGYLGAFETFEAARDVALERMQLVTKAVRVAAIGSEGLLPAAMPLADAAPVADTNLRLTFVEQLTSGIRAFAKFAQAKARLNRIELVWPLRIADSGSQGATLFACAASVVREAKDRARLGAGSKYARVAVR